MNLEERYNAAGETTYVGRVRARQAADAGVGPGVNFLDGEPSAPRVTPPNTYQREFTRNAEGALKYGATGQNGLTPGVDTTDNTANISASTGLTRWTKLALEKAFLSGQSSLLTKFKTYKNTVVHKYTPTVGSQFEDMLPNTTKNRSILGSASGPSPSGLQG